MRRRIFLSLLLLTLALSQAAGAAPSRAIWVWEIESFRLLDDGRFEQKVGDILRDHGIGTIYLYADAYEGRNPILEEPAKYRALISRLHGRGFRVEALLGSAPLKTAEYVLPEKDAAARAMLRRVIDYNLASKPVERFDAAHLDIEPYSLDAWDGEKGKADVARLYLARSREWVAMAREAKAGLEMGAAIPFWYDGMEVEWDGVKRPLNQHVQDIYDYVALMDYRDKAEGRDGIISHAQDEIDYGATHGRRVVVGLETGKSELNKLTFFEEGPKALATEMSKVEAAFAAKKSFGGIAIHHLDTWMKLEGLQ